MANENNEEFSQYFDYDTITKATFSALKNADGPLSSKDLLIKTIELMHVPQEALVISQGGKNGNRSKFNFRQEWCRTSLKNYPKKNDGYILSNKNGKIWYINPKYNDMSPDDLPPYSQITSHSASEEETLLESNYDWLNFYGKLADAILTYKNNRDTLAKLTSEVFNEAGFNIPTYGDPNDHSFINTNAKKKKKTDDADSDHYWTIDLFDTIDPFSIITRINTFKGKNRQKLCSKFIEKFNLASAVPQNFNGVPSVDPRKGVMVWCGPKDPSNPSPSTNLRQEDLARIDMLWDFFELVLQIKNGNDSLSNPHFVEYFNKTNNYASVGSAKITNVLFCIAPEKFMTVDEKSLSYLNDLNIPGLSTTDLNDGNSYCDFLDILNKYIEQENLSFVDLSASAYGSSKNSNSEILDAKKTDSHTENEDHKTNEYGPTAEGKNIIYYGIPGCGKSYLVNEKKIDKDRCERIVFYPDYMNSDFVGQILPQLYKQGEEQKVKYCFVAGPFTRILGQALKDKTHNYYLVIEELNRGNAAAIFGDIFQLLDRDDKTFESRYAITNKDVSDWIKDNYGINCEKIKLPANLFIYATMNTSDQNVYPLDTAFQRRWTMEYVPDDMSKCDWGDKEIGGENTTGISWKKFHDKINGKIKNDVSIISTEDKRLGSFFCSENEIKDINLFTNKVLKYLWDDAFKLRRTDIFSESFGSFEDLVNKIKENKEKINNNGTATEHDNSFTLFDGVFSPNLFD